jgi:hypothetical protein
MTLKFNPPPGWPVPPPGWTPPSGWQPDPSWPPPPPGWKLWMKAPVRKGRRLLIGLGVTGLVIAFGAGQIADRRMHPTHTDGNVKQLVATLGPACSGHAVPEARAFTGLAPLRLIILDDQGAATDETKGSLPDVWTADQIEVVICAGKKTNEQIGTCFYHNSDYNILRYAQVMKYTAVIAQTGEVIVSDEIRAMPRDCPSSVSSASGQDTWHGNLSSYDTVRKAVERQVADDIASGKLKASTIATPTPVVTPTR